MRAILVFVIVSLLLFAGCIKTGGKEIATQGETKEGKKATGADLGISDSDLQIDDFVIDPSSESFDVERP